MQTNQFEALKNTVAILNKRIKKYNEEEDYEADYNIHGFANAATAQEIAKFETLANVKLPSELHDFYTNLGSLLAHNNDEGSCMIIVPVATLLIHLSPNFFYNQTFPQHQFSLGIIDAIKFSWANDRPEFQDYFSQAERDALNKKYTCFAWYRVSDGLEGAYYLYFDEAGKFGALGYNQDRFDKVQAALWAMAETSPANNTLEEELIIGLKRIEKCQSEDSSFFIYDDDEE